MHLLGRGGAGTHTPPPARPARSPRRGRASAQWEALGVQGERERPTTDPKSYIKIVGVKIIGCQNYCEIFPNPGAGGGEFGIDENLGGRKNLPTSQKNQQKQTSARNVPFPKAVRKSWAIFAHPFTILPAANFLGI